MLFPFIWRPKKFEALKNFAVSLFTQTQRLSNAPDATLSDDMYQNIRQIVDPLETKNESLPFEASEWPTCENSECGNVSVINLVTAMSGSQSEARINPLSAATGMCCVSKPAQN